MSYYIKKISAFIKNPENTNFIYTCLALFITGVFALAIFYFSSLPSDSDPDSKLSEEDKNVVLSEIIKNNPKGIYSDIKDSNEVTEKSTDVTIKPNNTAQPVVTTPKPIEVTTTDGKPKKVVPVVDPISPTQNAPIPIPQTTIDGEVQKLEPVDVIAPDLEEYNYQKNVVTFEKGTAYRSCFQPYYAYFYGDTEIDFDGYKNVYYSYFDNNHSFYRYETYLDGEVYDTYIGKYGNDIGESYSYAGGEFVAKALYTIDTNFKNYIPEPASYPVSSPDSYTQEENVLPNVTNVFGPNAVVTAAYEENGKRYYDVQNSYTYYCGTYGDPNDLLKVIGVLKVDAENYSIKETKVYLNKISTKNLAYKTTNESSRETVIKSDIDSIFKNDLSDEVVTLNYRDYVYDYAVRKAQVKEYLTESDINILLPDGDIQFNYLYGKDFPSAIENAKYYMEKSFYADTDLGEQRYENLLQRFKDQPLVSIAGNIYDEAKGYHSNYFSVRISAGADDKYDSVLDLFTDQLDEYMVLVDGVITLVDGEEIETKRVNISYRYYNNYHIDSYTVSYPVRDYYADPVSFPESFTNEVAIPAGTEDIFEHGDQVFQLNFTTRNFESVNNYEYLLGRDEDIIDALLDRNYSSY